MSRQPVLVFVALACGSSWGLELASRALGGVPGDALHLAAAFGPSLAGLAAAWLCGGRAEARALLARLLRWRVDLPWYALALLGPIVIWVLACAYVSATEDNTTFNPAGFALFVPLLAKQFVLGGGLGEELGWRGFLQPALERRRSFISASVAVGAVWALWRAPVFLLQMGGRTGVAASLALLTLFCVAYSLIFARALHGARGSLLIVALLHAATSAAEGAVRNGFPYLRDSTALTYVYAGLVLALAVAAVVVKPQEDRTDSAARTPRVTPWHDSPQSGQRTSRSGP